MSRPLEAVEWVPVAWGVVWDQVVEAWGPAAVADCNSDEVGTVTFDSMFNLKCHTPLKKNG